MDPAGIFPLNLCVLVSLVWRETVVHRMDARQSKTRTRREQRGAGRLKAILWTTVIVFGAYAAFKIIPVYINEYQLADKMQEQARFAVVNHYTEEQIRDTVYKTAKELDIPVAREQIKVLASQQLVQISLDYTVPVDLIVYRVQLHFTPSSENRALF
jgi:cell division protein FtsL